MYEHANLRQHWSNENRIIIYLNRQRKTGHVERRANGRKRKIHYLTFLASWQKIQWKTAKKKKRHLGLYVFEIIFSNIRKTGFSIAETMLESVFRQNPSVCNWLSSCQFQPAAQGDERRVTNQLIKIIEWSILTCN